MASAWSILQEFYANPPNPKLSSRYIVEHSDVPLPGAFQVRPDLVSIRQQRARDLASNDEEKAQILRRLPPPRIPNKVKSEHAPSAFSPPSGLIGTGPSSSNVSPFLQHPQQHSQHAQRLNHLQSYPVPNQTNPSLNDGNSFPSHPVSFVPSQQPPPRVLASSSYSRPTPGPSSYPANTSSTTTNTMPNSSGYPQMAPPYPGGMPTSLAANPFPLPQQQPPGAWNNQVAETNQAMSLSESSQRVTTARKKRARVDPNRAREPAIQTFRRFMKDKIDPVTGQLTVDASRVLTEPCYETWCELRNKNVHSIKSATVFRRVLTCHLSGTDGRKHFDPEEEAALLFELRKEDPWRGLKHIPKAGESFRRYSRVLGHHERLRGLNRTLVEEHGMKMKLGGGHDLDSIEQTFKNQGSDDDAESTYSNSVQGDFEEPLAQGSGYKSSYQADFVSPIS